MLSNKLEEIGNFAFSGCENLSQLQIPKTVTKIGSGAFSSCDNLKLLVFENSYAMDYAVQNDIPYEIIKESIPGLTFSDGFVTGFSEKLTGSDFTSKYGSDLTVKDANGAEVNGNALIGTGFIVTFNGEDYTVVISGDLDGDGAVDADDAKLLKKAILGTATLEGAYLKAACVSGKTRPGVIDYFKVKKHINGTFNLYEN